MKLSEKEKNMLIDAIDFHLEGCEGSGIEASYIKDLKKLLTKIVDNMKHKIAILPTGEWAEIVNGEDVTYIYPDDKTFLALCNGNIDIDDAAKIAGSK